MVSRRGGIRDWQRRRCLRESRAKLALPQTRGKLPLLLLEELLAEALARQEARLAHTDETGHAMTLREDPP